MPKEEGSRWLLVGGCRPQKGSYWCQVWGQMNWKFIAMRDLWVFPEEDARKVQIQCLSGVRSLRGIFSGPWYEPVPFHLQNQWNSVLFSVFVKVLLYYHPSCSLISFQFLFAWNPIYIHMYICSYGNLQINYVMLTYCLKGTQTSCFSCC